MRIKQNSLFKEPKKNTIRWWVEEQLVFDGSLDYRKVERPFDSKKLVHAVFKADLGKAISFKRSERSIIELLEKTAYRYHIKIKSYSIQKDHIHLLVYPSGPFSHRIAQENFRNFLRFFAAEMGRKYKAILKRFGIKKLKSLWAQRPFTRLVSWGKKYLNAVLNYIEKNTLEALGFIEYSPRKHKLNKFLKTFSQKWRVNGRESRFSRSCECSKQTNDRLITTFSLEPLHESFKALVPQKI